MRSVKFSVLDALDDLRTGGFARPAAEKFGGAWLACFLVMARGNVLAAFSFEHVFRASVCGIVSSAVAVALLAQMDRSAPRIQRELLKLGFEVAESTVSKYMIERRGPTSQTWRTFLLNHADAIAAIDLCVVLVLIEVDTQAALAPMAPKR